MLHSKDRTSGITLIELLIVAVIISILIAIGGSLSSKFFKRRSVDSISNRISTLLNMAKLRAARKGLEYQLTINYDGGNNNLKLTSERGDSNVNSTLYQELDSHIIDVPRGYLISLPRGDSVHSFNFNPNGTLGGAAGSIRIRPVNKETDIWKCGRIVISPFGRIRSVIGRWDFDSGDCEGIADNQQNSS